MSSFGSTERSIAKALEKFPFMRNLIKESYKRLIYLYHKKKGFYHSIHPMATIQTAYTWAGSEVPSVPFFFGYYDKPPWSKDMTSVILHRSTGKNVEIDIVNSDGNKTTVGSTSTWNWQQGAMAQWMNGDPLLPIVYNTVENGILGCRIAERNGIHRTFIPWPVQAVNPVNNQALSLNYRRLWRLRPCYGYAEQVKNFTPHQALSNDGIWRIDLNTSRASLIIPLAELAEHQKVPEMMNAEHKVNHCIYSPAGDRFVFLYRFIAKSGKYSRLFSANADGSSLRLLMNDRMVSHYHWENNDNLLVWGRTEWGGDRYYRINVDNGSTTVIGKDIIDRYGDGHCSKSPVGPWIITDSYPDKARLQHLLLYNCDNNRCIELGTFFSPWRYTESKRCDLHPRWSVNGTHISIDSVYEGRRKSYIIDVSKIVGTNRS